MAYKILRFPSVSSTNDVLKSLVTPETPEGLTVQAKEQNAGKGRQGRIWESCPGNLYVSVFLKPQLPLASLGLFTYVASLAVYHTLKPLLPEPVHLSLKWPNDLLLEGKKISGILLESLYLGKDGQNDDAPQGLIIGVGINIAHAPDITGRPVTKLNTWCTSSCSVAQVMASFLRQLSYVYVSWQRNGFSLIRKEWMQRTVPIGTPLRIRNRYDTWTEGTFLGIAEDGALDLSTMGGDRSFYVGEIV